MWELVQFETVTTRRPQLCIWWFPQFVLLIDKLKEVQLLFVWCVWGGRREGKGGWLFCLVPVKFCTVLRVTYLVIRNETHCVTYLNLGLELLQGHRLHKLKKTTKSLGTAENKPWDKSSISKYDCVYHAKLIPVQLRLPQSDWSSQIWEQTDPMWQKCHPEHQILLYAHRRGLVTRMPRDFYPLSKHPHNTVLQYLYCSIRKCGTLWGQAWASWYRNIWIYVCHRWVM